MKYVLVLALSFFAHFAAATIDCKATVLEHLANGGQRHGEAILKDESPSPKDVIMTAELDGRAFVLSGNSDDETYMLSITWGPNYTTGSLTTASFSPKGRLQISTVDRNLVHKVECFKK